MVTVYYSRRVTNQCQSRKEINVSRGKETPRAESRRVSNSELLSASKFGKLSSGHRTGKGQFSFQSLRKAIPKNAQTIAQLHSSHANKVMLKILQARLQQYVNHELPDVQAGFRKGRGTRDQIANICWIIEKAREFQKNINFCFIDYAKVFDCVHHNKLWKILKEMGIPDHLTCLLRNLYAGQEATELDMEQQTGSK